MTDTGMKVWRDALTMFFDGQRARVPNMHDKPAAVITAAMAQDKAEIERLREALTHYAKDYDHNHGCSQWDGGAIARQALTESPSHDQ